MFAWNVKVCKYDSGLYSMEFDLSSDKHVALLEKFIAGVFLNNLRSLPAMHVHAVLLRRIDASVKGVHSA